MIWDLVEDTGSSVVERTVYGDGHLVRMTWRHRRDIGINALEGSAVLFIAGPMPIIAELQPEEPSDVTQVPVEGAQGGASAQEPSGDQGGSGPERQGGQVLARVREGPDDGSGDQEVTIESQEWQEWKRNGMKRPEYMPRPALHNE